MDMDNAFPEMGLGWYRLRYDLSVREGAGLNYPRKNCWFSESVPPGMLPAGSMVKVLEIKYLSVSVWGRIPEGWICMYMSRTAYVGRQTRG